LRSRIISGHQIGEGRFLSSNAQDFIEEIIFIETMRFKFLFLSSNAQDFIEDESRV